MVSTSKEVLKTETYARDIIEILAGSPAILQLCDALDSIDLKSYYIGAGAIAQSVWNDRTNRPSRYGISDIDIVYFDETHTSEEDERTIKHQLETMLPNFPLWLDIKNQARVHQWYPEKFGYAIEPYTSLEKAIQTWPTYASAVGIRRISEGKWLVYAPFGLDDIFDMRVHANSRQITKSIFEVKALKWKRRWAELEILDWSSDLLPIQYPNAFIVML